MPITPALLADCKNQLGEGIIWSQWHQSVFWTDIEGRQLWQYHPETGNLVSRDVPDRLCAFIFKDENTLLAAFDAYVGLYSLSDDTIIRLFDFEPHNPYSRLNDGTCDPFGHFIVGGINESQDDAYRSSVIKVDQNLEVATLLSNVSCTNSLCFSPDGNTLYFSDTPEKKILAYDYSADCRELINPRCVYQGQGALSFPDGATVDQEGYIWCAMWGGAAVIRINPVNGIIDTKIELPVKNPTCVAFGGPELKTLFITSSRLQMTDEELRSVPMAGGLFSVELKIGGLTQNN
jgi:L-arabinonolactonase